MGKEGQHSPTLKRTLESDEDIPLESFFSSADNCEMLQFFTCLPTEECYLNLPDDLVTDNPLNIEHIKEKQDADNVLKQNAAKYSDQFMCCQISTVDDVLCYDSSPTSSFQWMDYDSSKRDACISDIISSGVLEFGILDLILTTMISNKSL